MVSIDEAKRKLPSLVLVNGEDLTPYRADSKRIMAVLRRFGIVERHGLDEGAVDITAQVQARLRSAPPALSFSGHVLGLGAISKSNATKDSTFFNFETMQLNCEVLPPGDVSLLVGSQVVAEMRTAIEHETGFHCSCGVAQNKMLAKLSSSLNKPGMQTCLLQEAAPGFLAPLSVRKLPGVGKQMHRALTDLGVETISDLAKVTLTQLSERLGDRIALFLFNACRGHDPSPVQDKGPPKSISVEDSFRNCTTMQHAVEILRVLAPDLIRRLDEDRQETGRRPKSFTVKWRVHGPKWNFLSASTQMPLDLLSPSVATEKRAFLAVDVAMKLLSRNLGQHFHLVVLNIGATNFVTESASSSPGVCDIRSFLQGQGKSPDKELKVISKRDARAHRESFKVMATSAPSVVAAPAALTFQTAKQEMGYGLQQRLQNSDASTALHLVDEYHVSNNSEEEEIDDLSDQLSLAGQQYSWKQPDVRTMRSKSRSLSFHEQENSQVQQLKLLDRMWLSPSGTELSCGSLGSSGKLAFEPGKVEETTSNEAKYPMSVTAKIRMTHVFSAPKSADHKLPELQGATDAVPVSGELDSTTVEQHGPFINISRPDMLKSNSDENASCSEICQGRLNILTARGVCTLGEASTREASISTHLTGPSMEGGGIGVHKMQLIAWSICDECGGRVDESDSGRQEHADYHFALSLDNEERKQAPESSRVASAAKRDKLKRSTPPLKKSKSRNSTLDGFVFRLS